MITFTELREQLGISQPALSRLIRDGLPVHRDGRRKMFDADEVARWLVDNGRATRKGAATVQPDDRYIARTRKECAAHFGVHLRTVADWLEDETFPGRAGTRGRRDGYFPLEEIEQWLMRRDADRANGPEVANTRDELYQLKLERGRYEFEQYKRNLISIEAVKSEVAKLIAIAKKILESMPFNAAAALPADLSPSVRDEIIRRWQAAVREVEQTLSETVAEEAWQERDD